LKRGALDGDRCCRGIAPKMRTSRNLGSTADLVANLIFTSKRHMQSV